MAARRHIPRPKWRRLVEQLTWERLKPLAELCEFTPHAGQLEILEDGARFRVVCCGRRFGKSALAGFLAAAVAAMGGLVWVVAPTYDLASVPFDYAVAALRKPRMAGIMVGPPTEAKGSKTVRTFTGGAIISKSSDNPDSLLGRAPDLVIFEEAATEKNPEIWNSYLRPALMDPEGALLAISTPRGHNWFKDLYDRGAVENRPGWSAHRKPSWSNPILTRSEIDDIIHDSTEATVHQEIEAEFVSPAGAVFRRVEQACTGDWLEWPAPGRAYAIGADIAQYEDWTVIAVTDTESGAVVWADRFNQIDWPLQIERMARASERWMAPVLIDATNNNKVANDLAAQVWWSTVYPFIFTGLSKPQVVNQYSLALERGEVVLPASDTCQLARVIRSELEAYRYERSPAGNLRMNAPAGKHDDCVIAVVLSYEMARRSVGGLPSVGPISGGSLPRGVVAPR